MMADKITTNKNVGRHVDPVIGHQASAKTEANTKHVTTEGNSGYQVRKADIKCIREDG